MIVIWWYILLCLICVRLSIHAKSVFDLIVLNILAVFAWILFYEIVMERTISAKLLLHVIVTTAICLILFCQSHYRFKGKTIVISGIIVCIMYSSIVHVKNKRISVPSMYDHRYDITVCLKSTITSSTASLTIAYEGTIVFIESRKSQRSLFVLSNVLSNMPLNWSLQIFHSNDNKDHFTKSFLNPCIKSGRVILTNLGNLDAINTQVGISALLLSKGFWQLCMSEKILLVQTDSVICSKSSRSIRDFLKYDYIGAPWTWKAYLLSYSLLQHIFHPRKYGGNGGFSLRTKSKMIEAIDTFPSSWYGINEDVWFWNHLQYMPNVTLPSYDVAVTFSSESQYVTDSFGLHNAEAYYDKPMHPIYTYCPEAL